MASEAIVALSTPPGESGIAVVRMSGPGTVDIVEAVAPGAARAPSHTLFLCTLRDKDRKAIDEALVCVMRAPASYTGEDMAEISCHGSMQVVSELLEEILRRGARLAAPGEFTKRAFLAGKLDLAQAEAVADLISSETKLQREVAMEQLEGGLSRKVRELEERLVAELALIEVSIDFSEEDVPVYSPERTRAAAREIRGKIASLLEGEVAGERLRRGIRVTIVGPRNVGKSSLYNALIGEERAIVSPLPGTTRDLLRERIHVGGFTCHLEDTAGIAATGCEVEARGIEIGREAAGRADLVMFVVDGSAGPPDDFADEIARIDREKLLCVISKKDLGLRVSPEALRETYGVDAAIAVSSLTGEGLEDLRARIFDRTVKRSASELGRERIALGARHAAALREADEALARLEALLDERASEELLSVEVRSAADALGAVTGRAATDALLEIIFSNFCIGK